MTPETQCPGCGVTWVGHSGFSPTSGEFPSMNATSCPVHRTATDLLKALEEAMEVAFDGPSFPVDSRDVVAWKAGIEAKARAAIEAAK